MANWTTLKASIANIIKTNGNQEITGDVLQNTLNSIINNVGENATFAGVAKPSTSPGTHDGPVFYFAFEPGIYYNFSGYKINVVDNAKILLRKDGEWSFIDTGLPNSNKIQELNDKIDAQKDEVNEARDEAIEAINAEKQEAINNINSQRVTPEMLSQSTLDLINASGGGSIINMADDEDITSKENELGISVLKFADKNYTSINNSGLGRVYLRKNVIDAKNILTQSMINEPNTIYIIQYDYDLNENEITIPDNCTLKFEGGSIKNGTIVLNYTQICGTYKSFNHDIVLKGLIEDVLVFDYFNICKISSSDYDKFINGNNAKYGDTPTCVSYNSDILQMLITNKIPVKFLKGIYYFDKEVSVNTTFKIEGISKIDTLLFCPKSDFLSYLSGGTTNAYIKNIAIEASGNVIYTKANTVNAFHAPIFIDSVFISYKEDVFFNDNTISGGTGCPIYGLHMQDCGVCAANGKYGFNNWGSNSGIYDSVVDQHIFFNGIGAGKKGIMDSMFYNCSCRMYCNANITYHGVKHLLKIDATNNLTFFSISDCVFERGGNSLESIVDIVNGTNVYLDIYNCRLLNMPTLDFINIINVTNLYISGDFITEIKGPVANLKNNSIKSIYAKTNKVDSNKTKYRLALYEPCSTNASYTINKFTKEDLEYLGFSSNFIPEDLSEVSFIDIHTSANKYLPLCNSANNKNPYFGKGRAKSNLTFFNGVDICNIDGTLNSKVIIIDSYEDFKYYNSSGVAKTNIVFRIVSDIDLQGESVYIRKGNTIDCVGGSINNGTLNLYDVTIANFKGTANITGRLHSAGTINNAPSGDENTLVVGTTYFNTTNNKPIWWTGTKWVDATGTNV